MKTKKIDALTSMRFWMMVILIASHFEFLVRYEYGKICIEYLKNANIAVDFFFMLSGFGLAYNYAGGKKVDVLFSIKYAINRIKKLYALYVAMLIICIPYVFYLGVQNGYSIIKNLGLIATKFVVSLSMLQSATGIKTLSHGLNGVAWFISALFILYLICPLLLKCNEKIKDNMKSVLLTFLVNTVCMVILYSVFAFIEENTFFDDLVHGSPYIRIFYLNAGVLLADVVKRYSNRGFKLKNIGGPILIATIIGWIVYVKIFPVRLEIKNLIDYILCLGLIYFCTVEDGLLSKALSTKWNIKLGEATMYLYLIHYPVRMYIDLIFTELIVQDKWIYGILEVLLIILFTGLITFLVIKLKEANVEIRKKKRKV